MDDYSNLTATPVASLRPLRAPSTTRGEVTVCPRCGVDFPTKVVAGGRLKKYCSRACAFPKASVTRRCAECGVEYTRRADQEGRYCSRRCFADSITTRTAIPCAHCGTAVEREPKQLQQQEVVYCSQECKHAAGRTEFVCFHCGKPMVRATWEVIDPEKAYCSKECTAASRKTDPAWQDHARRMQAAHIRTKAPTKAELALYAILEQLLGPDGYEKQPPIFGRHPDAAIPSLKIAFQADGDYWHGPDGPQRNHDADRTFNSLFAHEGWTVVRIWERDLHRNREAVLNRIATHLAEAAAKVSPQQ